MRKPQAGAKTLGYVVVPNVLTADECGRMRDDLQRLKRDLHAIPEPANRMIEQAYFSIDQPHHAYLGAIGQTKSYPAILDYIATANAIPPEKAPRSA